jgi:hypothetical protein
MKKYAALTAIICAVALASASARAGERWTASRSCRGFVGEDYTQNEGYARFLEDMLNHDGFRGLYTECNADRFIIAECRMHPKFTIDRAAKDLIAKAANGGRKLPDVPMCGA